MLQIVEGVRDKGNTNFGVLYDTCHAHMCAAIGANQIGAKETLPGGELELLDKLKGKITHVHLIDSDGSLNEHNTSTHNPFGTGQAELRQAAAGPERGRRAERLVVRRSVLLAQGLGRDRRQQAVPRQDAQEVRIVTLFVSTTERRSDGYRRPATTEV